MDKWSTVNFFERYGVSIVLFNAVVGFMLGYLVLSLFFGLPAYCFHAEFLVDSFIGIGAILLFKISIFKNSCSGHIHPTAIGANLFKRDVSDFQYWG